MVCLPIPPLPQFVNYIVSISYRHYQKLTKLTVWVSVGTLCIPLHRFGCVLSSIDPSKRPADRLRPRVDISHRCLDVVVSCNILQRESVCILASLGQKRMAKGMDASVRINLDFTTEPPHLRFQHPRLKLPVGIAGVAEYIGHKDSLINRRKISFTTVTQDAVAGGFNYVTSYGYDEIGEPFRRRTRRTRRRRTPTISPLYLTSSLYVPEPSRTRLESDCC